MKRIFMAAIAASLLVSCSSKEISLDEPSLLSQPLVVQSSFLNDAVTTKADITITSGSLGVFRKANTTNGYSALNNVKYTYGSGSWTTSAPIYLNGNAVDVLGYYPHNDAYSNSATIPMTSQKFSDGADLCYTKAASSVSSKSPAATFAMSHAYSLITINFKNMGLVDVGAITNISIHNTAIAKDGSINITTNAYTLGAKSTDASPFSFDTGLTASFVKYVNASHIVTVKALVIPADLTTTGSSIDLSITIDGVIRTIKAIAIPQGKLLAANNYVIEATLDVSANMTTDPVKCTDWVDVPDLPIISPHR